MVRPCAECGRTVERPPSHMMRRVNVFCGRACQSKWRKKHEAGEHHHNYKGHKITCAYCGLVNRRSPSLINGEVQFCNMQCRGAWLRREAGDVYRKDNNHDEIVDALRERGCSVMECHLLGGGFPDIVVGVNGENYLLEIKNPKSSHGITEAQERWHESWDGHVAVVESIEDAYAVVGLA